MTTDLLDKSIAALGVLVRSREVSPRELIDMALTKVRMLDDQLHAFITLASDQAKHEAQQAEIDIARGHYRGALHGLPVGVKDQVDVAGMATTCGFRSRLGVVPEQDAGAIARLRRSGAIIIGKQNMSQFAMGDAVSFPFGVPRNPWNPEHRPGSSSSGSAAAVAARMCVASIAEDTGGSIRGPASYTGVSGLRPTWGRVSRGGVYGLCWSMDTLGPIAKSAEDCAIVLGSIAGPDPRDRSASRTRVPDYQGRLATSVDGLKLGVARRYLERQTDENVLPEVAEAVVAAASSLGQSGAELVDIDIPFLPSAALASLTISMVEGSVVHRDNILHHWSELDPNVRVWLATGMSIPAQAFYKAQRLRQRIRQGVLDALQGVDAILLPTSSVTAPRVDPTSGTRSKAEARARFTGGRSFFAPFNLAGVPAMSVPCGFSSDGLPIGLQIVGRPLDEQTVLDVGHVYQLASEWHLQRPPPSH